MKYRFTIAFITIFLITSSNRLHAEDPEKSALEPVWSVRLIDDSTARCEWTGDNSDLIPFPLSYAQVFLTAIRIEPDGSCGRVLDGKVLSYAKPFDWVYIDIRVGNEPYGDAYLFGSDASLWWKKAANRRFSYVRAPEDGGFVVVTREFPFFRYCGNRSCLLSTLIFDLSGRTLFDSEAICLWSPRKPRFAENQYSFIGAEYQQAEDSLVYSLIYLDPFSGESLWKTELPFRTGCLVEHYEMSPEEHHVIWRLTDASGRYLADYQLVRIAVDPVGRTGRIKGIDELGIIDEPGHHVNSSWALFHIDDRPYLLLTRRDRNLPADMIQVNLVLLHGPTVVWSRKYETGLQFSGPDVAAFPEADRILVFLAGGNQVGPRQVEHATEILVLNLDGELLDRFVLNEYQTDGSNYAWPVGEKHFLLEGSKWSGIFEVP